MLAIDKLRPQDRAAWGVLAAGYKLFYNTPTSAAEFDAAWARLLEDKEIHGLAARLDGKIVGIAHYLFHATVWAQSALYLQDLFVDETLRGKGIARALIDHVGAVARERGVSRYYWQTMQDNERARLLYDKLARFRGFIRYDYPVG